MSLVAIVLTYVLAPFILIALTAWIWMPIVFSVNSFFGGTFLGFIIGLVISVVVGVLLQVFEND